MKKQLTLMLCLALVLSLFAGCGSKSMDMMEMGNAAAAPEAMEAPGSADGSLTAGSTTTASPQLENQKLVRKFRLEAETETMDPLLAAVDSKITELGGYVESREIYNGSRYSGRSYRYADMVIRIPVDQLDSFVSHVTENANITSSNEEVDNITLKYVATQSRITALETEQTRLLELLAKAENMSDLLEIEARLTEVRTELENVSSQLRLYDNMVDYGTVTLHIAEVTEYTEVEEAPKTVWQRIAIGFKKSIRNVGTFFTDLFVVLIVILPYLSIPLVFGALVLLIIRLKKRKKKSNQKTDTQ